MRTGSTVPGRAGKFLGVSLGPAYWRLWSASTVSSFGDSLRSACLLLLAADISGDAFDVSLVTVATLLPWFLFGPIGGALGDRRDDRLALMNTCNALRIALMAAFSIEVFRSGGGAIWVLCLLGALMTTIQIVYGSAATGVLASMVSGDGLRLANARLETGRSLLGQLVGAPVGALLFSQYHWLPFALDAATFAAAYAVLPRQRAEVGIRPDVRRTYRETVRAGWRFVRTDRVVGTIALLLAVVNLVTAGVSAILVLYVADELHAPAAVYGLLGAAVAAGAFIGTFTTPILLRKWGDRRAMIGSLAVRVAALAMIGLAGSPFVAGLGMGLQGLTMTTWNVISTTNVQSRSPRELVGSVGTFVKTLAIATAPIGALVAGVVASQWDPRAPFLSGAVVIAIAGCILIPRLVSLEPTD